MTRTITLTKRETTHIQDLKLLIEREKIEILKQLESIIKEKNHKTYEELIDIYIKNKNN